MKNQDLKVLIAAILKGLKMAATEARAKLRKRSGRVKVASAKRANGAKRAR